MKNIFCCNTYYHLLISMIKAIRNDQENTLVIFSDRIKCPILNNAPLMTRLQKSKIFKKILIFDYSEEEKRISEKRFSSMHRFLLTKKVIREKKVDFRDYDRVYQFIDNTLLGRSIMLQKIHYILLEDGTDTYRYNFKRLKAKKNLKYYIKQALCFSELAQSKYIDEIEVNSADGLDIYGKKITECNKKKMLSSLSDEDKNKILEVFSPKINFKKMNNSVLLITQPLSEDNIVDSEVEKILLYKKIIEKYSDKKNLIIKTHPREGTDYRKYFNNCLIIKEAFPIELINFYPIHIEKVITIASTSAKSIFNSDNVVVLGWDWLAQNIASIKNITRHKTYHE